MSISVSNDKYTKKLLAISMIMFMTFLMLPVGYTQAAGVPVITVSNIQGNVGSTQDVSVTISNVDQMRGIQFDLQFTGDVSIQSCTAGDFFTIGSATATKVNNTTARILWYDLAGGVLSGDGNLLTVTVSLDGPSEGTINLTNLALQDVTGPNAVATINNGTINISYTTSQIVELVNNAASTEVRTLLETYNTELGLILTEYNTLSETGKNEVANVVFNSKPSGGYADASAIASAFNTAVSNQKAAAELAAAIDAVNNAADEATMKTALENNAEILGLNITGDYAGLNDKTAVATAMLQGQPYADKEAIISAFEQEVANQKASEEAAAELAEATQKVAAAETAIEDLSTQGKIDAAQIAHDTAEALVTQLPDGAEKDDLVARLSAVQTAINNAQTLVDAVAAVNGASDAAAMKAVLEANALTLGLDTTDYDELIDKLAVATAMLQGRPYANQVAIGEAFNTAVIAQKAAEVSINLSGMVTISDSLVISSSGTDKIINAVFVIDGVEYQKQLTFTNGGGTASFTDLTFGTTISDGVTLLVKVPGYVSSTFTFTENIADNESNQNPITIEIKPGNLTDDNTITSADLTEFGNAFNTTNNDNDYNELADINKDGEINVKDLYYLGKYYVTK